VDEVGVGFFNWFN